jgi:hypothetical protein
MPVNSMQPVFLCMSWSTAFSGGAPDALVRGIGGACCPIPGC